MTKKEAWQRLHEHCLINGMFWPERGNRAVGVCGMLDPTWSVVGVPDRTLNREMKEDLILFEPVRGIDDYASAWWGGPTGVYTPLRQTIVAFLIEMSDEAA